MASVLAETLGRQLLQSDIWFLADKCANLVKRIHEPLERSVAVLDNILTIEDDDTARTVEIVNRVNIPRPVGDVQMDEYLNRQFFFGELESDQHGDDQQFA